MSLFTHINDGQEDFCEGSEVFPLIDDGLEALDRDGLIAFGFFKANKPRPKKQRWA